MIEYKGEKGCQTGVCAAECVDWEDNGKRQNECRGNEKGRWNEWDRQCRRGKKKKKEKTDGALGGYLTLIRRRQTGWPLEDLGPKSPNPEWQRQKRQDVAHWYWPLHADCFCLSQFLFPGFIELCDDFFWFLNTKRKNMREADAVWCNLKTSSRTAVTEFVGSY